MRSMLDGNIDIRGRGVSPQAQMTAAVAQAQPKRVQTVPITPRRCRPRPIPQRRWRRPSGMAIQSDLAWVGQYNGAINGEVSERMVAAIKEFQKDKAASRPACSIRRSAACCRDRAGAGRMDAGWKIVHRSRHRRSARACRPSWCRSNPATPTAAKWSVRHRDQIQIQSCAAQAGQPAPRQRLAEQEEKSPRAARSSTRAVKTGFLRAVGHAGPEEILHPRHDQGRRGPRHHRAVRPGHRRHHGAGGDRDVERVHRVSDQRHRADAVRRRARWSNTAPASSSAPMARSSPTA